MSISRDEIMKLFNDLVAENIKSGHPPEKARRIAHETLNAMMGQQIDLEAPDGTR